MSEFSERLFMMRHERGFRQADIAQAAHVTVRAYQYYEKGEKEPTLSVLVAIADFYNVTLDYLCGRSERPERV